MLSKRSKKIYALVVTVLCLSVLFALSLVGSADEPNKMSITAESKLALANDTVEIKINVSGNAGVSAMKLSVSYSDILNLVDVKYNNEMGGIGMPPEGKTSPVNLTWANATADFSDESFTFATLVFEVSSEATLLDTAAIEISYVPGNIYNLAEKNIDCELTNGCIIIAACMPGDINNDFAVNMKDYSRLFQYMAGWEVEVNPSVLDVNGDRSVNMKDYSRLFQYIAGWEVDIFPKYCDHPSLTEHPEKEPTATEAGNIAYSVCDMCNTHIFISDENEQIEISSGDIVLEATGYSISFVDYDEITLDVHTVKEGENDEIVVEGQLPSDPTRSGYKFNGWESEGRVYTFTEENSYSEFLKKVTGDIEFKANYSKLFTVNFLNYDGSLFYTQEVPQGGTAVLPKDEEVKEAEIPIKPTRTGYKFVGWDGEFTNIQADITLKPIFKIETYTVTYVDIDGTVISEDKNVEYCSAVTLPESLPDYVNWEKDTDWADKYTAWRFSYWAYAAVDEDGVYQYQLDEDGIPTPKPAKTMEVVYGKMAFKAVYEKITAPVLIVRVEDCDDLGKPLNDSGALVGRDGRAATLYLFNGYKQTQEGKFEFDVYGISMRVKYNSELMACGALVGNTFDTGENGSDSIISVKDEYFYFGWTVSSKTEEEPKYGDVNAELIATIYFDCVEGTAHTTEHTVSISMEHTRLVGSNLTDAIEFETIDGKIKMGR